LTLLKRLFAGDRKFTGIHQVTTQYFSRAGARSYW
jgi:hypothetical protein